MADNTLHPRTTVPVTVVFVFTLLCPATDYRPSTERTVPMNHNNLDSRTFDRLLPTLLADAGAGWDISGSTGSGKTSAMELLFLTHVRKGGQAFYLDPHGNSAKKTKRMILDLPDRLRKNILYIRPCDPSHCVSINPLAVPRDGLSEHEWKAKLSNKVGHMAKILLAAWGESGFLGRPVLRKWATRWLRTLAFAGLSVSDVRHFLDVTSPVYQKLLQLVPDLMARHEMAELSHLRLSEREEQIASAKNRFTSLVMENPIVEAILGTVDGALDIADVIQGGTSIILDLEKGGNLSDEDQQIIANIWLTELIHTVMTLPEALRPKSPLAVFMDELPCFESSASLLLDAACEIRKYNLRFFFAHQGSNRFPGRQDNEFLNTIIEMCRVHLYFRHVGKDAKFFAEILSLEDYDPHREKLRLTQLQQYQDGHEIMDLIDEAESLTEGETAGGAESQGQTSNTNWQDGTNTTNATTSSSGRTTSEQEQLHQLQNIVTNARNDSTGNTSTTGSTSSRGGSEGTSIETSNNWSRSLTRGRTRTRKQTLVPIIRTREVITSVTFYTPEEQEREVAAKMAGKDTGEAFLHFAGRFLYNVQLPLAIDHLARTPRTLAKLEAAYDRYLQQLPFYNTLDHVFKQRHQVLHALLRHIDRATCRPPDAPFLIEAEHPPMLSHDADQTHTLPASVPTKSRFTI